MASAITSFLVALPLHGVRFFLGPSWGWFVCCIYMQTTCIFSRHSGFLPKPKDMHFRQFDCKLAVKVLLCAKVNMAYSVNHCAWLVRLETCHVNSIPFLT